MNKFFIPFLSLIISSIIDLQAQTETQPFGKIDVTDLQLESCSFEKDANAMVLFDKGDVYFDHKFDIVMERHKRIKIFNEKAKDEGNIRLEFFSTRRYEAIYDIQAQTINLKDGKTVITKLDRKQFYTETIDKNRSAIVFTFPDVQAGSVIEFKYKWQTTSFGNFPSWFFQGRIPVRYSEVKTSVPDIFYYRTQYKTHRPLFKNISSSQSKSIVLGSESVSYILNIKTIALENVESLADEPYMTSRNDNLESLLFQLSQIRPVGGFVTSFQDTWEKVGGILANDEDFGLQFRKKIQGEDDFIAKAKAMKSDDEKIAYLFREVRNAMKWNGYDIWYTSDGTSKAWQQKTGNSTEINLILYRLLKEAGVQRVYPMIVSTRNHGKVNVAFPWLYQFNRTVVHIPVDSTKRYVLDASNKYQLYNNVPDNLLNSYGLSLDKENKRCGLIEIINESSARKNVLISAEITDSGHMKGNATLHDFDYHKIKTMQVYNTDGEDKFKEWLREKDNQIKINSVALEGAEVDSLPLIGKVGFEMELNGANTDYLYFSPNLFSSLRANPFISENRSTLIDFGHKNRYTLMGTYKVPSNYTPESLPKSLTLVMPDKSISFQRMVAINEGTITLRYVIDFKKTVYVPEEYSLLREFYKQMFDMLNEQIVLKKS